MQVNSLDFALAAPEILMLILACGLLLLDAFLKGDDRTLTYRLTQGALALVFVVTLWQWQGGVAGSTFQGLYVADDLSYFLKLCTYAAMMVTLAYGHRYVASREMLSRGGEFYVLALLATIGQMVMISAGNMITIYLGLEVMSLALYALVALRRENVVATEAAMKYFVLGSLASGILLYGMSMLYGATGTLDLSTMAATIALGETPSLVLSFGIVFVVAGLAFKLGVVPFHMWAPDVYQGAPTTVTLLIGGAPKLATFAITVRLLGEALPLAASAWEPMLAILAVLSLVIGNLTAIAQTSFKRMLAYSTIAHMGFVLLGLMSANGLDGRVDAYGASLFYVVTYVLTTLGTFGLVLFMSRINGFEADQLDDLKGLSRRSPWFAAMILLMMFSLTGIPPTVGFYAKLAVLQVVIAAGHLWLAVIAVMASLVGAFYYLRVVKLVYFDEPSSENAAAPLEEGGTGRAVLSVNGLLVLGLGILPAPLMALCLQAMSSALQ
ncbi:MAG: NADH-quinone oxidoreductase subunit NuoN [Pigmentiphaga sp.]|nr:NADH-quinone oxidoreductase subunit NuoN [Pigmentiphaga sp.]